MLPIVSAAAARRGLPEAEHRRRAASGAQVLVPTPGTKPADALMAACPAVPSRTPQTEGWGASTETLPPCRWALPLPHLPECSTLPPSCLHRGLNCLRLTPPPLASPGLSLLIKEDHHQLPSSSCPAQSEAASVFIGVMCSASIEHLLWASQVVVGEVGWGDSDTGIQSRAQVGNAL